MVNKKSIPHYIYEVIIIGGGPSGLTAGVYSSRARLKTLLIENLSLPSQAVLTDLIENYPGFPEGINGFELIDKMKRQAKGFGLESIGEKVKGVKRIKFQDFNCWEVETESRIYKTLSLIIASGARPKKLEVPGEEKFSGRGVSYCAVCDAPFFKDKEVVVIGGGNTALEEALFLAKFAKKVTLIHRRERLRAVKILQEKLFSNEKIEVVWNSVAKEIFGKEYLEGIRIKNIRTAEESEILCRGVFVSIGLIPNTEFMKGILELDDGYIIIDERMKTSQEGIFACGDCTKTILRQIITACGDGAKASFSAQRYVEEIEGVSYK